VTRGRAAASGSALTGRQTSDNTGLDAPRYPAGAHLPPAMPGDQPVEILFIGDLVGPDAVPFAIDAIARLRRDRAIDAVIVNTENAAHDPATGRYGTSPAMAEALLAGGADVLTGGNHTWDRADAADLLAMPRVLRPANVPPDLPGHGAVTITTTTGETLTVVNLVTADAFRRALPVWPAWEAAPRDGTVVVDLHGSMPVDKRAFALAVAGEAAAVLGTHTHEPSLPLDVLPGGTAFVAEVGCTGPSGGAGGADAGQAAAAARGEPQALPSRLASGPMSLAAVIVSTRDGRAVGIERVS
jgi:2',3'-cyclic-nucleotide 2'-phosphodiesterase